MVKTIRLNKKDHYMIDKSTSKILDKYDPENNNIELIISLDDSMLKVDSEMISCGYGGQIIVQHNNDRYIIDDGYRDTLVKAGYIVYEDYDQKMEYDKDKGLEDLDHISKEIKHQVTSLTENYNSYSNDEINSAIMNFSDHEFSMVLQTKDYEYKFVFNTINDIVHKNISRKDNSLPFYPFNKNIDKYRSMYVSVFALKKHRVRTDNAGSKYKLSTSVISDIISELGPQYHFLSLQIKPGVIYWEGL